MNDQSLQQISPVDLNVLLDTVKNEVKREMNCVSIGTINSFDPVTQTANISLNYKRVLQQRNATGNNTYTDVTIAYPLLLKCPVIFMNGGGGYTTYPIQGVTKDNAGKITYAGDTCLVLFCDRDIDLWLEQGSTISPPNSDRMHDLSDAVALVGLSPVTKPIAWATDGIVTAIGQVVMKFTSMLASIIDSTGQRLPQSGFGQMHFGSTLPSGWLWCDGSLYSVTQYPQLFAAIGYTYGGSGITFMVPDLRGKVPVGCLVGDSDFGAIGNSGGEKTHKTTILEMPSHVHPIPVGATNSGNRSAQFVSSNDFGSGHFTDEAGGDQPHNNLQPFFVCNYIIKI